MATEHWDGVELCASSLFCDQGLEGVFFVVLNVYEEEAWCLFLRSLIELAAQVAVNEGKCNEQRQAEAEREHDRRCQCAGAVDVGDCQTQLG